jgi:Rrf2 family protein
LSFLGVVNISAKSRYAVRALVELAEREQSDPGRPVRLGDIAVSREIPAQFLEQLFSELRRAGLLRSRRGARGGFSFARSPDEVTVLDVVETLDGLVSPATCTQGECDRLEECGAAGVWIDARHALEEVLGSATIAVLLERERRVRERPAMYFI